MEVGLESDWLDLCDQEAADGSGWHELDVAWRYMDSHEPGDGYLLSRASEDGHYYGQERQRIDEVFRADVDGRKLPALGVPTHIPGRIDASKAKEDLGATMDWGEWGQEGKRGYDKTCYVKHEKVSGVRITISQ